MAVVPVVLFHAGTPLFRGGFVGVDVFFVISGHLITSLILGEIKDQRFRVLDFYQRRIRRIFPALYAVLIFCMAAGALLYTPNDLQRLGQAAAATTLFLSNVLFWKQTGYFGVSFEQVPLLHTWSLAVEEQFYLVFPFYLLLIRKLKPVSAQAVTLALCLGSLLLSILWLVSYPRASFFLAPSRFWELLVGALLAMNFAPPVGKAGWHTMAGLAGLFMIAAAVVFFSEDTPFPGITAVLPVLGAACVIWSGANSSNIVCRTLSGKWLVSVGKISYSIYLWHFPLLAFAAYLNLGRLTPALTGEVLVCTLGLSIISWRWIEQPFRRSGGELTPGWQFFGPVVAVSAAFCFAGLACFWMHGFPMRLDAAAKQIVAEANDFDQDRQQCLVGGAPVPGCRVGDSSGPAVFALWGDSHAEAWRPALDDLGKKNGAAGTYVGRAACAPLVGIRRLDEPECVNANDEILAYLKANSSITTVILSARWALWAEGSRYKEEERKPAVVRIVAQDSAALEVQNNHDAFAYGIANTIKQLTDLRKRIWIIGPVPEIGYRVPKTLYLQHLGIDTATDIRPSKQEYLTRQQYVLDTLEKFAQQQKVHLIRPDTALCGERSCKLTVDGKPIYVDDNHLSTFGARSVSSVFAPLFEPVAGNQAMR